VRHEIESDSQTVDEANHRFVPVDAHGKLAKLIEFAHAEEETGLTLVFVNTKRHVETLARQLRNEGVPTVTMHGDMTQQAREKALQRFEDKHVGVLIATDVAARGLDLDDITLVVNYDPPQDDKGYVHRVGRTARAGRAGTSVTFVTPDQLGDVSRMAARLDLHAEFELEGMKVAPPRTVFSGSTRGRRSGLSRPKRRR
jgi:superfamily II DNA/RNA helicase